MNSPLKERHRKGVANHPDPDFCGGHREAPESDLVEKNGNFEFQIAVSGFEAKDLHMVATPLPPTIRASLVHLNGGVRRAFSNRVKVPVRALARKAAILTFY